MKTSREPVSRNTKPKGKKKLPRTREAPSRKADDENPTMSNLDIRLSIPPPQQQRVVMQNKRKEEKKVRSTGRSSEPTVEWDKTAAHCGANR